MKVGMLPRRSSKVCILTAALCFRNFAQGEQRQTQIDGGGVQCIQALVEIRADRIGSTEGARDANQDMREVGKDTPVTRLVGVGQRGARYLALETHVVHLGPQGTEACLNIAQALSVSKLRKSHGQILIPAREAAQAGIAVVTSYATTKFPIRQEGDQLRKHRAALVHKPLSAASQPAPEADRRSNRGKYFRISDGK